ncbi:MAG: bifunctional phosphoribosylaminoimidazolecarboxamide formyltransferase/IMP cyclohydrolase [Sumerlaeia bacterium]
MAIQRALISVSDKTGVVEFAQRLAAQNIQIVSTGGTAKALREAGLVVRDVADLTGFPEMLGGRVKTLHPMVHGGILARRDDETHMATIAEHGISAIDLVVVNLYPFQQTVQKPGVTFEEAIEQIDIGGPTMLRSAAKNMAAVTVVCDPEDYPFVAEEIEESGDTTEDTRQRLAAKVFATMAAYEGSITSYLSKFLREKDGDDDDAIQLVTRKPRNGEDEDDTKGFEPILMKAFRREKVLRYGENPHQAAAFYSDPTVNETSLANARQLSGKELSYNNFLDAEGALEAVRDLADLAPAACVIVKHSTPCGMAIGATPLEAYEKALATDPDSAFGGIVAFSCEVDEATAEKMAEHFLEVVIAPAWKTGAVEFLALKKKNLRLMETGPFTAKGPLRLVRGIVGGALVMERDMGTLNLSELKVVTETKPSEEDLKGLLFAWRCVKWVKSNAIVYTDHDSTIGIGGGQTSRVNAARFGAQTARRSLEGAFMGSDAFFPFRDNIDEAAKQGIRAIIQPGGSIRDEEVIAACNEHGIAMVFTGMRHFRH